MRIIDHTGHNYYDDRSNFCEIVVRSRNSEGIYNVEITESIDYDDYKDEDIMLAYETIMTQRELDNISRLTCNLQHI